MEEIETTSLWEKKADEITVGDEMKVVMGATALIVLVPMAIYGVREGVSRLYNRYQARKAAKQTAEEITEEK